MTEKLYHPTPICRRRSHRFDRQGIPRRAFQDPPRAHDLLPRRRRPAADAGTINGLPLLDLVADGDDIVHVLGRDPGEGEARLRLDFPRRYDHMQQHTAQHLLSQVLRATFNAATLSFAIGPEHSSIEIDRPDARRGGDRAALETECARLIFATLPVRIFESDDVSA